MSIQGILFFGDIIKYFIFLTGYISNSTSFPKPLNKDEEAYYLGQFVLGDIKARNILIERNLRLVAHIVKKYNNTGRDIEDLISIGTIGLIKAISTYDAEKGTRLATYAARCIENEILMSIRSSKKTMGEMSIHEPIGIDKEGNEISLLDILGTSGEEILEKVHLKLQTRDLYKAINKELKEREKRIVELRYGLISGKRRTQREVATLLGISRSYVSRIEKHAIEKLSRVLNK